MVLLSVLLSFASIREGVRANEKALIRIPTNILARARFIEKLPYFALLSGS
jgi:hypothetical protein